MIYFYFLLVLVMFIIKLNLFTYPTNAAGIELASLFMFLIICVIKLYIGNLGILNETSYLLSFYMILSFFEIYSYIYFGFLQTYVLKIELIINCIWLIMSMIGLLFAFIARFYIKKKESKL